MGKTNYKYQLTGFKYNMYLKRKNKKNLWVRNILWKLWYYVSDNRSQESDLRKVAGVGVVVFQNARSRSWIFFKSDSATMALGWMKQRKLIHDIQKWAKLFLIIVSKQGTLKEENVMSCLTCAEMPFPHDLISSVPRLNSFDKQATDEHGEQ